MGWDNEQGRVGQGKVLGKAQAAKKATRNNWESEVQMNPN